MDASSGREVRVFDLLRGPQWTLLTFDHGDPARRIRGYGALVTAPRRIRITTDRTATGRDTMIDTAGRVHRHYDIAGDTTVLIRPDGYIAARDAA
ncbi:hypothetical protein OG804_15525 [Nocardia sp. NBC_00416]